MTRESAAPLPLVRRRAVAVALAALFTAATVVVYLVSAVGGGHRLDEAPLTHGHVDRILAFTKHVGDTLTPTFVVVAAVVAVVVAAARADFAAAAAAAVMVVGASATTAKLDGVLPHVASAVGVAPRQASYPSGHVTAAASVGLAFVLAAPARLRGAVAAVGAAYAAGVGAATLAIASHFPSDVVGGYLVAGAWGAAAAAVLARGERSQPVPAAVAAALAATAVVVAAAGSGARDHPKQVVAVVYAAAAASVFAAVAAVAGGRRRA